MRPARVLALGLLLAATLLAVWSAPGELDGARLDAAPELAAVATAPEPEAAFEPDEPERPREAQPARTADARPREEEQRATLELTLLDADTGAAFAGTIDLWRVGLPETERMTAGDARMGEYQVPLEGLRLEDLEPGEYRATCHERRYGADDPPAFELRAPLRSVALTVERPRERAAYVELVTETGLRLNTAEMLSHLSTSTTSRDPAPRWPSPRRPKEPPGALGVGGGGWGGSYGMRSGGRWREVRATSRGFPLGTFPEDRADRAVVQHAKLRVPGRAEVRVAISGKDLGETRYVALCPRPEAVLRSVHLPDGRDARLLVDAVRIEPAVQRLGDRDLGELWRELEVKVSIDHPDYEPREFRWSPETRARERWLRPRQPADEDS